MDFMKDLELFDCPICHGTGILEEEKVEVAKRLVSMWNVGKVIPSGPGE